MAAKRVLVTGANKGIGLAIVRATLDAEADTFVFLGSRDTARGEAARDALVAARPEWADRVAVVALDVTDDDSVKAAMASIREAVPGEATPLYGVVNNAGIGRGSGSEDVLNVNLYGPHRVCEAALPLLADGGRVVNVSSASGPNFVARCSPERQKTFTDPDVTWEQVVSLVETYLGALRETGDFAAVGLGDGDAYGMSKACLNAYTMNLARRLPNVTVNACTPGFIETDLTRPYAEARGVTPEEMGMKPPAAATRAPLHLLLGDPGASGWYFGSDAERSPLDRYRSPGDPPYTGD